jgi:hypothetical protein
MSEPAAEKKEAPPARAPAIGELLELSLTSLVNAPGVFAKLESRPFPGPGAAFLAALFWGALFFALNLVHVALSNPALLRSYPEWQIAAVGLLGLGAWASLYLLASSLVYGLGRGLGSAGDFDRALLVAAVALAAAPVQAMCRWFPAAWAAPALVAAWITACGLEALFKANAWAARGACAALAAAVIGLQYGAGLLIDRYAAAAQMAAVAAQAAPSADQLAELQRQMQRVQEAAMQAPAAGAAPAGPSSLDLLRGPAGEEAPAPGPTDLQQMKQMTAQGDAMNKSMAGMLDTIAPLLNNPMITQNMSPAQKADYAELTKMIQDLKAGMASDSITSQQEQQAKMMKIQQLVMRLMSAGMTMPKAAPPAPGAKK